MNRYGFKTYLCWCLDANQTIEDADELSAMSVETAVSNYASIYLMTGKDLILKNNIIDPIHPKIAVKSEDSDEIQIYKATIRPEVVYYLQEEGKKAVEVNWNVWCVSHIGPMKEND